MPAIQVSHRLHEIKNVWLIDHTDCGGFGGLQAFENDEQKEVESHLDSMQLATGAIHKVLPELVVISFVATLDGELVPALGAKN